MEAKNKQAILKQQPEETTTYEVKINYPILLLLVRKEFKGRASFKIN
jgi:hypothetical protein